MDENVENKVRGILGLYNFYKYQMNTVQRIAMLSLWIEASIDREEYEVAAGLQKELDKITSGEEEFQAISPFLMKEIEKQKIEKPIEPLEPVIKNNKKFKFINYWGSGSFELIRISFQSFKFIIFNFGIELK